MNYEINKINYQAHEGSVRVFADSDTHFYTDGKGRYGASAGLAIKVNGWWTQLAADGYAGELNVEIDEKTFTDKEAQICSDPGFLKCLKELLADECGVPNMALQYLDYAPIDRQITGRVVFEIPGDLDTWFRKQVEDQLINPESIVSK